MKKTKRFLAALLAAVLMLSLLPAGASAQGGDLTVLGGTEGTDYTYESGVLLIKTAAELTISGTTTTDTILVEKDVDANLTLSGVNIDVSGTFGLCAFAIAENSKGNVHITLAGDNVLKSGIKCAGLQKNGFDINPANVMGTLTIGVDDGVAGSLTAVGGGGGAGIGGGVSCHSSNIIITGGTVTANGGDRAHSPGNYYYGDGAGIGGGGSSSIYSNTGPGVGSHITISGGTVTARSSGLGAGIGGGGNHRTNTSPGAYGEYITISGGTVIASGATGIGGGSRDGGNGNGGYGRYITISGGTVTATGDYGAGIGGGTAYPNVPSSRGGDGYGITISGGTVIASGDGGAGIGGGGAGIGGGGCGGDGLNITISGGMVTTTGSNGGAGIGAGGGFALPNRYGDGSNIIISSGTVTATAADGLGAGIGGGADGTCGNVTISGGSVTTNLIGGKVGGVYADAPVKAADGVPVYLTTVTLQGGDTVKAAVSSLGVSLDGNARAYGVNGMFTDANGRLYLYLPGSAITTAAQTTDAATPPILANYTGSIETTNDNQAAGTLELDTRDLTVLGGTEGTDYTYESGVLLIKTAAELTISGTTTTDTILVEKDVDANLTLSGVNIDVSGTFGLCAFAIAENSKGNVNITLAGNNVLKSGIKCAGLQKNVTGDNFLNADIGLLTIDVGDGVAGSLTAVGGGGGAGIGGGLSRNSCNITISGGTVTATGGDRAHSPGDYFYRGGAGIGGGGSSGTYSNTAAGGARNITISGGTVTATGNEGGAGIGGGGNYIDTFNVPGGPGQYITISSGTVIATGGTGIGGGGSYHGSGGLGSYITISSGTVIATGDWGAGIGGGDGYGYSLNSRGGDSNYITISGGTVTATSNYGAGIGGGHYGGDGKNITISGGMVTATSSEGGAGIGAGGGYVDHFNRYGDGSNITISGGTVTAASNGAGIGGGAGGTCGNVTISGGSVKTNLIGGKVGGVYTDATVKAADGVPVYRTTVTLQGGDTVKAAVSSLGVSLDGEARDYGVKDMFTDANGRLYLYLPGSAITTAAQTTDAGTPPVLANYTGSIETTNDNQAAGTLGLDTTVTFDSQGGSPAVSVSNVPFGYPVSEPEAPVRPGYTFGGWYKEASCTNVWNFGTGTVTGDTTLYAKWTAVSYTLTCHLDGGAVSPANPASYTMESDAITLNNPTRLGYTFTGWSGTDITGTSMSVVILKGSTGNRSYTAHWTAVSTAGTVTIISGGNGTATGGGTYNQGQSVTLGAVPAAGYNFDGWYEDTVKVSSLPNYSFTVTTDITLTAKFTVMQKDSLEVTTVGNGTVTLNGGSTALPAYYLAQHTRGDVITLTATAGSGNAFAYWQDSLSGSILSTSPAYEFVMGAGVSLKAVFSRVPDANTSEFTVIFKDKSGKILQSTNVAKNGAAIPPASPSLVGYSFADWDKTFNDVTSDMTVNALYERLPTTYMVTVVGGTLSAGETSGSYRYDMPVTVVAGTAASGQKFSHWEQDGVKISTDSTYSFFTPMRATTLTAVFVSADTVLVEAPFITLSATVQVDTVGKNMLFTANRTVPAGYTLIESGVLLLKANTPLSGELTVDTAGVIRGKIKNDSTDQFHIRKNNITGGDTWYARAYLIYRDADGNIITVYSANTESRTMN